MKSIKLFVQGEGLPQVEVLEVGVSDKIQSVIEQTQVKGLIFNDESCVMIEDSEEELGLDSSLKTAGVSNHCRLHVHRCKKVEVTVRYNGEKRSRDFPPSTTIKKIHRWVTGPQGFNIPKNDAAELGLKLCGINEFLDEDVHIGTLVHHPKCDLCFDLAPKVRVEG